MTAKERPEETAQAAPAVHVLGAVKVGGVVVGGKLKRRLVGQLVLAGGRAVRRDAMIDAMWGEAPPPSARGSLHVHLNHLRQTWADHGVADAVETTAGGYRLRTSIEDTDVGRFDNLVALASTAMLRGDLRDAHRTFRAALDQWDEPYTDLPDHPDAIAERQRLLGLHDRTVDDFAEATMMLGALDDAVTQLETTVARAPLRERPYAQLMQAYGRVHRHVERRGVFEFASRTFAEALGAAPSPWLRTLLDEPLSDHATLGRRPTPKIPETAPANRLLELLHQSLRPVPGELLVRAAGIGTTEGAASLRELVALGWISTDAAGRVDALDEVISDNIADLVGASGLDDHVLLADAAADLLAADHDVRVAHEAHHRLRSGPAIADQPGRSDRSRRPRLHDEELWALALDAAITYDRQGRSSDIADLFDGNLDTLIEAVERNVASTELLLLVGRSASRAGRPRGRELLDHCVRLARTAGDNQLFAEAVRAVIEERTPQRATDDHRTLQREALDLLAGTASDTRVQLMTDLANSWYLEQPDRAEQLAAEALDLARSMDQPATIARALTGFVQSRWRSDNADDRLGWAIEAQEHARRADSAESHVLALTYEVASLVELGRLSRAEAPLRYAEALAEDTPVDRFRWWCASWRALLEFARGDLAGAEARFESALGLLSNQAKGDAFDCYAAQIAAHRLLTGRAGEVADAALTVSRAQPRLLVYRAVAARCYADIGALDTAAGLVAELVEPGLDQLPDNIMLPTALTLLAETAHACELDEYAPQLRGALAPIAHQHAVINVWGGGGFYWGAVRHGYGLALHLGGDTDAGLAELRRAAREQADAGAVVFAARSEQAASALS